MTWATRTTSRAIEDEPRALPPDMLEAVSVRALVAFGLGDRMVGAGEIVQVSRARGSYLIFLRVAEFV